MRVLALDIGEIRTGIAVSDPCGRVATPVCVLSTSAVVHSEASFRRVLDAWQPELLLCGLPYTLSGQEAQQAQSIRQTAQGIARVTKLPLQFTDERLSSREAKRILREKGLCEKEMRGKIDMIAASLFLQTWLDARNTTKGE